MHPTRALGFLPFAAACTTTTSAEDDTGNDTSAAPDTAESAPTDTADSGDTADTSDTASPDTPVITDLHLSWEDYPDIGLVLYIDTTVADSDSALESGMLFGDLVGTNGTYVNFDAEIGPSSGSGALLYDGHIYSGLTDLDEAVGYTATVSVRDTANHDSNEVSASIVPM